MNVRVQPLWHPFRESDVRELPLGGLVALNGIVYTGRDRLHRFLHDGGETPVSLRDGAIFHCGPVVLPDDGGSEWRVVAAGPTTSAREDPYMPAIIARHGLRIVIGKGGMGPAVQTACRDCGCVYIQVVGGAAAWLARCVQRVRQVWFLEEFGATEAMWAFEVRNLTGIVAIDARGRSLYDGVRQHSQYALRRLLGRESIPGEG